MKKYVDLFNEIIEQKGKGSKERKIQLVKDNKDDKTLFEILLVAFNDRYKTGLGTAKVNKKVKVAPNIIINDIVGLLHYVTTHSTGTDQDIANIQYYLDKLSEEEKDLVKKIITKSLKLGVSRELNGIFSQDIVIVPVAQKGENAKDFYHVIEGKLIYISEKLDGQRGTYEKDTFLSYNREEYKGLNDLISEVKAKLPKGYVFDGELLYRPKSNEKLTRKEIRSRTATILNSDLEDKKDIEFVIFDIVKESKWNVEVDTIAFQSRRELLEKIFSEISSDLIRLVEVYSIQIGLDNMQHWLDLAREKDLEGVIVNIANAPYEYKRSQNIFKLKDMDSLDLEVIDLEEGKDSFEGMLGAFIVDYKGNRVHVGGGREMTHEFRKQIWENRNSLSSVIGKLIEVNHFGESMNKATGLYSLSSPQFAYIRYDKNAE